MSLVRFSQTEKPYADLANKIRHIYNAHLILKDAEMKAFFKTEAFDKLLTTVGKDDIVSFKNNNKWLHSHLVKSIVFSNPEETWDKIKNTYGTTFKELIIGHLPAEADLIDTLKQIHSRFKKVE